MICHRRRATGGGGGGGGPPPAPPGGARAAAPPATRVIRIKRADGASVGALMMHFMLETILAAHLLGVNPFDQPAVETCKRLARERLGAMSRK